MQQIFRTKDIVVFLSNIKSCVYENKKEKKEKLCEDMTVWLL